MTDQHSRWRDIWIPLLSTIVALSGVFGGVITTSMSQRTEVRLKEYEVTFLTKQQLYSTFVRHLSDAFTSAYRHEPVEFRKQLDELETTFYGLEPFLREEARQAIWEQLQQFQALCYSTESEKSSSEEKRKGAIDSYLWYRQWFRQRFMAEIFSREVG